MARKIISVSISEEEFKIVQQLQLKPSQLIQAKIQECKENLRFSKEEIEKAERARDMWHMNYQKALKFILNKGLYDEFKQIT